MGTTGLKVSLRIDTSALSVGIERARASLAEFAAAFLGGREGLAALHRARRASPPPMPALGARYHQRARRRTRRNR